MSPSTPSVRSGETPRQIRHRLNKMESWCERNADRLGPAAVRLRALFELATTAEHADYLAADIRELAARLSTCDAAPQPGA